MKRFNDFILKSSHSLITFITWLIAKIINRLLLYKYNQWGSSWPFHIHIFLHPNSQYTRIKEKCVKQQRNVQLHSRDSMWYVWSDKYCQVLISRRWDLQTLVKRTQQVSVVTRPSHSGLTSCQDVVAAVGGRQCWRCKCIFAQSWPLALVERCHTEGDTVTWQAPMGVWESVKGQEGVGEKRRGLQGADCLLDARAAGPEGQHPDGTVLSESTHRAWHELQHK